MTGTTVHADNSFNGYGDLRDFLFYLAAVVYKYPIVELSVLKNGNLRIGVILSFIMGFGLFGSTFVIPLYTQSLLGWTATIGAVAIAKYAFRCCNDAGRCPVNSAWSTTKIPDSHGHDRLFYLQLSFL